MQVSRAVADNILEGNPSFSHCPASAFKLKYQSYFSPESDLNIDTCQVRGRRNWRLPNGCNHGKSPTVPLRHRGNHYHCPLSINPALKLPVRKPPPFGRRVRPSRGGSAPAPWCGPQCGPTLRLLVYGMRNSAWIPRPSVGSPAKRPMTCRCAWKISCPATAPVFQPIVHPDGWNWSRKALAASSARPSSAHSDELRSKGVTICRKGTTMLWAGLSGSMLPRR